MGPAAFRRRLFAWHADHYRSFPWRETTDAFQILVAEVLLQRSRAKTVAKVHASLFDRWPTAGALAEADPTDVEKVIRPAGLVKRAGTLVKLAHHVESAGAVPADAQSLPGVGPYASRATSGLPVVDATSARVYRRYFGLLDVDLHKRVDAELWQLVEVVTPSAQAREMNWAVLDLAAEVCLPKIPRCEECPVRAGCVFGRVS